ncbi:MAG: hypothetical protein OXC92_09490 [Flavobacteriaceae bacterium]|nr:hypothetical protein [Flavobacteriaceae bacterium]
MAKKPAEKLPFESLPNHENIPLALHLKVHAVMSDVFREDKNESKPKLPSDRSILG